MLLFIDDQKNKIEQIINSNFSLLKDQTILKLIKEEIFILILQKSFIRDKFLEKLLTNIRKEILFSLEKPNKSNLNELLNFIISFSMQSFLNEYVFFQSEEEVNYIRYLEKKLSSETEINELETAVLGSYIPLIQTKKN